VRARAHNAAPALTTRTHVARGTPQAREAQRKDKKHKAEKARCFLLARACVRFA
jgi:hypothetical protein